jgi:trehalose 6-phosphate synthase/phosphatase
VSGRSRDVLDAWLGDLPVTLWAEHCLWRRNPGEAHWHAVLEPSREWKASARPVLDRATDRTPGSIVEDKGDSIAWHYRLSDPLQGREQAHRIRDRVEQLFPSHEVETVTGSKVLELRPRGVNKGLAVQAVQREHPGALVVAIGDDRTDEDMFAALPQSGIAIHVGTSPSKAGHRLAGPAAIRELLETLAGRSNEPARATLPS